MVYKYGGGCGPGPRMKLNLSKISSALTGPHQVSCRGECSDQIPVRGLAQWGRRGGPYPVARLQECSLFERGLSRQTSAPRPGCTISGRHAGIRKWRDTWRHASRIVMWIHPQLLAVIILVHTVSPSPTTAVPACPRTLFGYRDVWNTRCNASSPESSRHVAGTCGRKAMCESDYEFLIAPPR